MSTPNLPALPRFTSDSGPSTPDEWSQLWRYLNSVYRKVLEAATVPQSVVFNEQPEQHGEAYSDRELPFLGSIPPVRQAEVTKIANLAAMLLGRPPYPAQRGSVP